jgi:hypothetical protein
MEMGHLLSPTARQLLRFLCEVVLALAVALLAALALALHNN